MSVAIVELARLGVREDLVGLGDLAEAFLGVGRIGDVRMQLAREAAERPLDLLLARAARDAQQLVVVALGDRGRVADGAHRDRLGDRGGEAGGEQNGVRTAAGDHAQDDAQDVDQAILATQDDVAQPVALPMGLAMWSGGGGGAQGRGPHGAAQPGGRPGVRVGVHRSLDLLPCHAAIDDRA